MRLAIVGSRSFSDYELFKKTIDSFANIETIISGGARGADSLARRYAKENGLKLIEFLPDWDKYGKSAGYRRNIDIVSACDYMVAFWDGKSKGTKHDIEIAKKLGRKFKIILF